eukprot:gb/GFBE01033386.1/.p1 GENE.gb/GFBE01033386.1/~~gb/GFBE01033386.1/.p1  ORF type:complete len:174 (+),score=25.55 gb/GFBE01033386.1/:1-522(+)
MAPGLWNTLMARFLMLALASVLLFELQTAVRGLYWDLRHERVGMTCTIQSVSDESLLNWYSLFHLAAVLNGKPGSSTSHQELEVKSAETGDQVWSIRQYNHGGVGGRGESSLAAGGPVPCVGVRSADGVIVAILADRQQFWWDVFLVAAFIGIPAAMLVQNCLQSLRERVKAA